MRRKNFITIFCLVCLIVSVAFCGYTYAMGGRGQTEKIEFNLEVILPLTGNLAFLGVPVKNALILAKEDWKDELDKKDISVNLLFGDSQGNPKTAVTIHNQNKALKSVHGLFSFLSGQTLALKPLAERDNIIFIASTVDPSVCENSKNLLRPYYSFGAEGKAMLTIVSEKDPQRVGIIYSTDSATSYEVEKVVLPGLKKANVSVIVQTYEVRNRDFRTQVFAIKQADPDIILTYGFGSDLPFLVNTLKEQGVFGEPMVIGPIGIADAIPSKTTKPFTGMYYFGPTFLHKAYEEKNPKYSTFKAKYIERYGADQFNESSVYAYDTYSLLAQTILKVRSTVASVLMNELKTKKISGLAGEYIFDEFGNCDPPVGFAHISDNGEIKLLRVFNGK